MVNEGFAMMTHILINLMEINATEKKDKIWNCLFDMKWTKQSNVYLFGGKYSEAYLMMVML